jgi:hypothetical protein
MEEQILNLIDRLDNLKLKIIKKIGDTIDKKDEWDYYNSLSLPYKGAYLQLVHNYKKNKLKEKEYMETGFKINKYANTLKEALELIIYYYAETLITDNERQLKDLFSIFKNYCLKKFGNEKVDIKDIEYESKIQNGENYLYLILEGDEIFQSNNSRIRKFILPYIKNYKDEL